MNNFAKKPLSVAPRYHSVRFVIFTVVGSSRRSRSSLIRRTEWKGESA